MLKRTFSTLMIITSLLFAFSCASPQAHDVDSALASLTAGSLAEHVKVLSSDEFEGRAPVSEGEEKTVQYLEAEFKKLGAQPGNGESYFQDVPLVEITPNPDMTLTISGGKSPMDFSYGDNFVGWSPQAKEEVEVTDDELGAHIARLAAMRGTTPDRLRAELDKDGQLEGIRFQVRQDKTLDLLVSRASVTEVEPEETPSDDAAPGAPGAGDAPEVESTSTEAPEAEKPE